MLKRMMIGAEGGQINAFSAPALLMFIVNVLDHLHDHDGGYSGTLRAVQKYMHTYGARGG